MRERRAHVKANGAHCSSRFPWTAALIIILNLVRSPLAGAASTAKLAVIPIGVNPCGGGGDVDPWGWLEHLPHEIVAQRAQWTSGGFVMGRSPNVTIPVETTVVLVSESVRVEIGSLLLSSAVFTGVDARQRLVWCIPIQSIISQLLDVWTLTGLNSQFESLVFVVQPGFQHWLNQTLHPLVEDGGYSGVVYGYAPQCKRLMDDEPFPFPSESRIPTPSSPPHHTASHPSVIDRSASTASWKLSPVLPKQWNGSSWPPTALTSSWVSSSNTIPVAMMDVEAGPFSWGFGVGYTGFHRPHRLTALEDGTVCANTQHIAALLQSYVSQHLVPVLGKSPLPLDASLSRHFPSRILYRLFVVKSHVEAEGHGNAPKPLSSAHTSHSPYDPVDSDGIDISAIRKALQSAALPGQDVFLTAHNICVDEDIVLATALATSLRHDNIARLTSKGQLVSQYQPYIDSSTLAALVEHHSKELDEALGVDALPSLHVPILVISMDSDPAVLIDGSYQSRPALGMVVSVQGPSQSHPSPLHLNDNELTENLRDPTKAIISAALELVYGYLPSHLTVSAVTNTVEQDWNWIAGDDIRCSICGDAAVSRGDVVKFQRHAAVLVTEMSQSVKATCQSAVDTATDVLSAVVVDPDLLSVFDSVIGQLHTLESSLASLSSVNQSVDALRLIAENNLKLSRDCDTLRNVTRLELCHLKRTRINEGAAPSSITYVSIIVGGAVCVALLFYVLFKASSTGPAPYDPAKVKIN